MGLKLITGPAAEPVSLTEAKLHLRVDSDADNALIPGLITAARMLCESYQSRAYLAQTLELRLDAWPREREIELPRPPLALVTSVKWKDSEGTEHTMDTDEYLVDTDSEPGRIVLADGCSWPSGELYPAGAVAVRYAAGAALAASVPQNVKQAILLTVGDWYQDRQSGSPLSAAARALLVRDRMW